MKYFFKFFILMMVVTILCGLFLNQPIKAADNEELVLMFSAGGSGDTLANSAKKFEEKTGIKTKVLLYAYGELNQKQILALSQKNSIPDVIAINDEMIGVYEDFLPNLGIDQNKLDSLMSYAKDAYERPPQGSNNFIALPVRNGGNIIIYRDDILKENNIDIKDIVTWEDYLEIAKKLTKPEEKQWAYADGFQLAYVTAEWINFIYSYNAEALTSDGKKAAFNTENGIKATQMYVDLFNEVSPPGSINYGYGEQVEGLQRGSIVMSILFASRYLEVNSPKFLHSGKFKVLPNFPYGVNTGLQNGRPQVSVWGLGLNPYSQNKEAAMKFIEHVASEEEQLRLAVELSNSPTVKSVYLNPDYLDAIPDAGNISRALEDGRTRPHIEDWNEVSNIIGLQLQRALVGDVTVKEALATAEEQVNKILEEE